MPTATDFEKLGVFYLGRPYDLRDAESRDARAPPLRLEGPRHPRGLRRHDRQRQDRPLHRAARGGRDRRHPRDRDRSQGRPRQPAADLPRARAGGLRGRGSTRTTRGGRASTPDDYAAQQAELWRKGLGRVGPGRRAHPAPARRRRLRHLHARQRRRACRSRSSSSFAAPPAAIREDGELLRERVATTATSLLGLARHRRRPDPEPRAHPARRPSSTPPGARGATSTSPRSSRRSRSRPMSARRRAGPRVVLSRARSASSSRCSSTTCSPRPGFAAWLRGRAARHGPPAAHARGQAARSRSFSIAHLGDAERMFFVSLLLNQVLAWMRAQSGTTSLRAILYMDEIFGYFPPVANPPSKRPLLTLLKQARAFGARRGARHAEPRRPRLQGARRTRAPGSSAGCRPSATRRACSTASRARPPGRAARFDRGRMEEILAGLGNRVFLMNNVHEDGPVVFETRWAMSYLRGPLTRRPDQDADGSAPQRAAATARGGRRARAGARPRPRPSGRAAPPPRRPAAVRPVLPPDVAAALRARARLPRRRARRWSTSRCCSARPRCASRTQDGRRREPSPWCWRDSAPARWPATGTGRARAVPPATSRPRPQAGAAFAELPAAAVQEEELRGVERRTSRGGSSARRSSSSSQPSPQGSCRGPARPRATSAPACTSRPRAARRRRRASSQEVRAEGGRVAGAHPPRRAGAGARVRAGDPAGAPGRDLRRRHADRRTARPEGRQQRRRSAAPPRPRAAPGAS